MTQFTQKGYRFCVRFLQLTGLLLTAVFLLGSFLATCYAEDMTTQQVLTVWDNPLVSLLGILLFTVLLFAAHILLRKWPQPVRRCLLILVCGWYLLAGACLILFSKTVPAADALSVYSMAEQAAAGNMSVIHSTDSYISYYPQQSGLMLLFELFIRLWKLLPLSLPAYHFIKCVYILLALVIICSWYRTIQLLCPFSTADGLYLLLAGLNAPLLMYTSFVYGEIPSFAAFSIGVYFLLRYLKEHSGTKRGRGLLAAALIACTVSVMLRKNSLILIIAMVMVALLHGIRQRSAGLLLYALLLGICALSVLPLVQKSYEMRSGNTIGSGVPAIAYFAMGMQNSSRGNGWYNGFNFDVYQSTGMDSEATALISQEAIQERLHYFRDHPSYAADFYLQKHLSQWSDGTYACRQATLATYGGRRSFFQSLYEGKGSHLLIQYCNAYQNILYLGCFLFFLSASRLHKTQKIQDTGNLRTGWSCSLPLYLGFIGVIGGFLFHIIWEANSRYIFCYGLLLLPYGAAGLGRLLDRIYSNNTFLPGK